MKQKMNHRFSSRLRRVLSGVLCAVMLCGLLPEGISLSSSAQAAEAPLRWSNADLQALNDYDIMRGNEDGDMMPDKSVTRAEFVAMVNRALGYSEKAAKNPFKDVAARDWFSDDVSISYNMGYFSGTANATASPHGTLTREQALVLLGRNLMLQPKVGESFSYADTRTFGDWSRSYIDPAVEAGIIDANRSADFNPQKLITRGELAGMLVRTIGTRISTPGVKNLGTVDGNVTITTSNVTLRNTTVNGDLYLTGGIGLGDVHLDNVTVNGKIMDAGAGLSEKGDISVILNNVTADELVVDSMRNQTISLRTSGNTSIPMTSVRTSAYLDDSTPTGYGLRLIEVDGEEATAVTLSGNIKEVHNKTPKSSLNIGEGVADKVTVDEAATGSTLTLGKDARIKELNLDAGIKVDGGGSIDKVNISANGATVAQLPDEIVIAPGITATVNKQKMDTAAAVEASSRPRLASGYPFVPENNINPTGATALFMTNKPGTIYWALTAKASGSPSEEDIISPPTYAKYILKSGKIQAKESNKEYTAKISGLTSDGSYYLSAILVDDRGTRSAMKVTAFDTPDNTTPAFSSGYPTVTATEKDAQLSAMTTKNCYLYYTVLPKGSSAPRGSDFQAGSITGNLGYGVVRMAKNSPAYIYVNDVSLEEKVPYVLYLWLTDFDGAKSSAVKAVNFTTGDKTDPIVTNLRQTKSTTNSVTVAYALNEPGTLYWAVVKAGDQSFMSPSTSGSNTSTEKWLESRAAMERIIAGTGALKSGKSPVPASKVGADVPFTVSSLKSTTTGTSSYDLYYVAVDAAGNWSKPILSTRIYTDDKSAPTVELKFTSFSDDKGEDTSTPLADTSIRLVFSKPVRSVELVNGVATPYNLLDLNNNKEKLAEILRKYVKFYRAPNSTGTGTLVEDKHNGSADWVIDYTKARVYQDGTSMVVEFPNDATDPGNGALRLANGAWYYFVVSPQKGDFQDTTVNHNEMSPASPTTKPPLRRFQVKSAQIDINPLAVDGGEITYGGITYPVNLAFQFDPISTATSPKDTCYDVMLWSDTSMTVNLFRRESGGIWQMIGSGDNKKGAFDFTVPQGERVYNTVATVTKVGNKLTFDPLRNLDSNKTYEYAMSIVSYENEIDPNKWNINANFEVTVAAGTAADLQTIAKPNGKPELWTSATSTQNGRLESIGNPDPYTRRVTITDSVAPELTDLSFKMRDTSGSFNVALDRPGDIYWALVKLGYEEGATPAQDIINSWGRLTATVLNGNGAANELNALPHPPAAKPWEGSVVVKDGLKMTSPNANNLISNQPTSVPKELYAGRASYTRAAVTITPGDLDADSWYAVYMMFGGNAISENAVGFRFKTHAAYEPILTLETEGTAKAGMVKATVYESSANVNARLIPVSSLGNTFYNKKFSDSEVAQHFTNNQVPTEIKDYTVLKALIESSGGTEDPSMFDKYASDSLKNYVANLIKSGSSTEGTGSISTKQLTIAMGKDNAKDMAFDGLAQNLQYFCVAVAENTSNSNKRGFRATQPVEVVDTNPATVSNVTGTLQLRAVEDATNHQTTYVLTGTMTISYRGYLYVNDTNGTTRPFTQGGTQNNKPFFGPADGAEFNRDWAGAASLTNLNNTGMFEARALGGVATMTQSLTISVKDTRTDAQKTTLPEGYVYETISWTESKTTDENGKEISTWTKPDYPVINANLEPPTQIVNRNGTTPTNTGKITYTNVSGGKTNSTVTVTYR